MSLLNVTQLPTIVIIDSNTGRPLFRDSALAIEWNDPHDCLNAWQAARWFWLDSVAKSLLLGYLSK
jgi:hypothetical protein